MRERAFFFALLGINFLVLVLQIKGLSIGYHEAMIVYGEATPLSFLINASLKLFGENDYALRLPMILLHLLSLSLMYQISKHYVARENDRLWIALIYALLPGVSSAALVVDNAGLVIASLFLSIYLFVNYGKYALATFPVLIFIDPAFAYLFFGVALYGIIRREYHYTLFGIIALGVSLGINGIHVGGSPESRFLDLLGVYTAIFSPLVFLYLFYVLYRRMIAKEWDLIWSVAMSAFVLSVLLSFRQKVEVQTFAPFVLLALPLAGQTFLHTYRIRLREFRGRYRALFYTAFFLLVVNALAVFFNHYLYRFVSDPSRHFSYPMHVAKELAAHLKKTNIGCVNTSDQKLRLRLQFYGITQCDGYRLDNSPSFGAQKVTISYTNKPIYETYVTKVNK